MSPLPQQTHLDFSISALGTMEGLFSILAANNRSITDIPATGLSYIVPADAIMDVTTLTYLAVYAVPGTLDSSLQNSIGYMSIGNTFRISQ